MGQKAMNHKDVLYKSASILNERGSNYGDIEEMFTDAALMASIVLGKDITKYDVTTIFEMVKLRRRRSNPKLADNYIDNINYTAFSAQFALNDTEGEKPAAVATQPVDEDTPYVQDISVHFDGVSTTVVASPSH
jgi:Domain of unknown function (DUF6378)